MQCLKDFIGIGGCGVEEPLSGLLINDLAGISLKSIAAFTDAEMDTYKKVYEAVQKRAIAKFSNDIQKFFESKIRLKNVKQSVNIGSVIGTNITSAAAQFRGFTSDLTYGTRRLTGSQYHSHYIQSLSYYSDTVISDFSLQVIDVQRAIVLDTFTFDVVVGWNTVQVEKRYQTNILKVCYDATLIDSVEHQIPNSYLWNWIDLACTFGYCGASLYGSNDTDKFSKERQGINNSFGVSAIMSIVCTYDNIVCNNLNYWKLPFWYLLGIEMLTECLYSERLNKYTTVDRDLAVSLRAEYQAEYQEAMDNCIKGYIVDTSDGCVECTGQIQTWFAIP